MSTPSRGRRALLIVAVLLAVPVLGAGLAWFWIQRTADRKWAEVKLRIQELTRAFPTTLPPLPSSEISKELQIHLVAVIREAARRNDLEQNAAGLAKLRQSDEKTMDVVLGNAQDFLDRLHEGARRCAATPGEFPPGWRGEWDGSTLNFVMNCAVLRARRWKEKGADWQAAETILDSFQLARFWAASGKGDNRLDAIEALLRPLEDLRDLLTHGTFSRDQLLQIDRELEPLDAALRPPSFYLEATLARWASELEAWDVDATGVMSEAPYRWRYLLPMHLMKAEAFEFYDRHIARLMADEGKPYLELRRSVDQFYNLLEESKNPLLSASPIISRSEWIGLERMAQVRLLRIAAHYLAGSEILKLKDPFGGEFLHSRLEKRMKFWSLGEDGRDDGGDAGSEGRWTYPLPVWGPESPRPAKDLVIEVPSP